MMVLVKDNNELVGDTKNGKERGLKVGLAHNPFMSKAYIRSTHS